MPYQTGGHHNIRPTILPPVLDEGLVKVMVEHSTDVTMGAMASQITSLTSVYSTIYSGADKKKHQSSASLVFVRGIHRWPVNSPHKGPVTRKMFPFDDVIMGLVKVMINGPWLDLNKDAIKTCNRMGELSNVATEYSLNIIQNIISIWNDIAKIHFEKIMTPVSTWSKRNSLLGSPHLTLFLLCWTVNTSGAIMQYPRTQSKKNKNL